MGRHDDNDDSIADWFVNRDREFKGWPVGPLHPSQVKTPAPSAPQQARSDEELARNAYFDAVHDQVYTSLGVFTRVVTAACATARAQGRADALAARGEASPGTPPETPATAAAPATGARERVAEAIWKAWWLAHGEHETEILFPQLYENARERWLRIADAGIKAWKDGQCGEQ